MNFNASKIIVLTTGGTIEKIYQEDEGKLENLENKGEFIRQKILAKLRLPYTALEVHALMSKDSLQMIDSDREFIYQTVLNFLKEKAPIVVLHGTDTMEITAQYCFSKKMSLNSPLLFTGAMSPLGFEGSDALQNVTEALLASKLLPAGIYISFHNQIFEVPHVKKNREKGTFQKK